MGDDPFDLDDEQEETPEAPAEEESNPVKQLREALEREKRKRKKIAEKVRGEVLAEVARKQTAADLASALGNPKAADLFLKVHPEAEVTEDAFKQFFTDYGFEIKATESEGEEMPQPETTEQVPPASEFHKPVGPAQTPGNKKMTGPEAEAAYRRGEISPEEFTKLIAEGRIVKEPEPIIYH
jgi:hypothetical protein